MFFFFFLSAYVEYYYYWVIYLFILDFGSFSSPYEKTFLRIKLISWSLPGCTSIPTSASSQLYNHDALLTALFFIVSSPPCHHATYPSTYMFTFSPFSCEISIWSFSFSFCASSCCLQIPFDEEAIRRALIAVHNFAVPQIKVLVFFHSLLSSHFVVGVCTAGTVLSLPTQP